MVGHQPEATYYLRRKLARSLGGVEHDQLRALLWRLELGELAVHQRRGEEVAVPADQPGVREFPAEFQEGHPGLWPPGEQLLAVALLQRRAPGDRRFARRDAFIHPRGDRGQPWLSVSVGERDPGSHLGDVRL